MNAEVVGVCVSRMCGSERVEVTGTLLSSPFLRIFSLTWHPSHRGDCDNPGEIACVARQGSNLQSSVTEYLVPALLQNKFTLDFFLPGGPQEWDRTCNLRFRQQARGEKVPRARNRRFERWSPQGLLEGHVSTLDGDTLARLNRYRRPIG